jgi:hypothetical protein
MSGSFDHQLEQALRNGVAAEPVAYGVGIGAGAVPNTAASSANESLRAEFEAASARFEQLFRRLLADHNIEVGDGVVLAKAANGEVQVIGEHQHKLAIEQLFRDDLDLLTQFSQLEAQAPLVLQSVPEFAADSGQLLASSGLFSLVVRRDSMTVKHL